MSAQVAERKVVKDVLHWQKPVINKTIDAEYVRWVTRCGRYTVARTTSNYSFESYFNAYKAKRYDDYDPRFDSPIEKPGNMIPIDYSRHASGRPRDYGTLEKALEVVEEHYCEVHDVQTIETNILEILAHAKEENLNNVTSNGSSEYARFQNSSPTRGPANQFGATEGTNNWKITQLLTNEWQSMKELATKAGIEGTTYGFLNKLAADKKIDRDKSNYRLKQK